MSITPQPWIVVEKNDCLHIAALNKEGKAVIVARIENKVSKRPLDQEDYDNAELIAKVPKMLWIIKGLTEGLLDGTPLTKEDRANLKAGLKGIEKFLL